MDEKERREGVKAGHYQKEVVQISGAVCSRGDITRVMRADGGEEEEAEVVNFREGEKEKKEGKV